MLMKLARYWRHSYSQTGFAFILALAVLLLPITSFPKLAEVFGGATVVPISAPIFLVFSLIWLFPYLFQGGRIPFEIKPFGAFLLVVGLSLALSFFLPIPPYKDHLASSEVKESILTLSIAVVVYVTTAGWAVQDASRMKLISRWVSVGGLILVLWSLTQAYVVLFLDGEYPRFIYNLQDQISARQGTILFKDRITGMAYEPSWLAHQLVLLYIPLWLSQTITGYSAFRKAGRISVENILLVAGIFILFMTFSRIGWASFLLVVAFLGFRLSLNLIRKTQSRVKLSSNGRWRRVINVCITICVFLLLSMLLVMVVIFLIWVGSKLEPRIARMITYDFSRARNFLYLTNLLFFAERAVYWVAGWEVFSQFPLFGVGIGNSGFFFPQTMPSFGYGLTEIRDLFYRFPFLPNTKSMWIRLFAETGIVGVAFFAAWIFTLLTSSASVKKFGTPELKPFGWMGQLTLIAFIAEGFSLDSFAMPYFWFAMGLVSAAAGFSRRITGISNPDLTQ
jgi:hypothetical protein